MSTGSAGHTRPKVWELLALVALAGVGLACSRAFMSNAFEEERRMRQEILALGGDFGATVLREHETPNWLSDPVHFAAMREAVAIAISIYSFGLFILELIRTKGRLRYVACLPGASATVASVSVLTLHILGRTAWLTARLLTGAGVHQIKWTNLAVVRGEAVGGSVLAVWLVLFLAGRLRTEWDWIEVLAFALGVLWILDTFTQAAFVAVGGR
jgi:hypothetical protein